ncbi:hypothetical protein BG011_010120 [Mortierella polycephala]|uniref:NTF2-domain-containing protein n=1 Tax=Mortierella polycephala TaxID=41804 RepID=A0A9P6PLV7_9FUNG|nr:hypothetical protein BG011_010120 [Mortierella polycephala]
MTAISESPAPNGTDSSNKLPADDIGRIFVHDYYTFLHKEPSRLHLFYNKSSTLSHGTQGEDAEAIRDKILSLGFEGCKVLVSNLDCQSSNNGGIVIQVLGEMSNRAEPSQRFVQTFFLAAQHMGYYVLNDIFRYLKEDTQEECVEEAEDYKEAEDIASQSTESFVVAEESETTVAPVDVMVEEVTLELEVQDEMPAPAPAVVEEKNRVPEEKAEEKADKKDGKKSDKKDSKDAQAEIKEEAEVTEKQEPTEPAVKESVAPSATVIEPESAPSAAPEPAPASVQPPKPKTWANLFTAAKAAPVNVAQASPKPQPQSQASQAQASQAHGQNKPQGARANGREEYHSIYIKNVTERMTIDQLREAFTKFGRVKHLEFTQKRNCAFLDFATPDAVVAALKQNTVPVGNEIVHAEERRRNSNSSNNSGSQSGRTFQHHHHHNSNNVNGHGQQQPQGSRGGRANNPRGGPSDRRTGQVKPEKAAHPVHVK